MTLADLTLLALGLLMLVMLPGFVIRHYLDQRSA